MELACHRLGRRTDYLLLVFHLQVHLRPSSTSHIPFSFLRLQLSSHLPWPLQSLPSFPLCSCLQSAPTGRQSSLSSRSLFHMSYTRRRTASRPRSAYLWGECSNLCQQSAFLSESLECQGLLWRTQSYRVAKTPFWRSLGAAFWLVAVRLSCALDCTWAARIASIDPQPSSSCALRQVVSAVGHHGTPCCDREAIRKSQDSMYCRYLWFPWGCNLTSQSLSLSCHLGDYCSRQQFRTEWTLAFADQLVAMLRTA